MIENMVDLRPPSAGDTIREATREASIVRPRTLLVRPTLSRRRLMTAFAASNALALAGCETPRRAVAVAPPPGDGTVPMGSASPLVPVAHTSLQFGCDSSYSPVTQALMEDAILYLSGRRPVFWGRYFNHDRSYVDSRRLISYRPAEENSVLGAYGCRVLPVFAQNRSHLPLALGKQDGWLNGKDFIENLGAASLAAHGKEYLMFLNVENGAGFRIDYWLGWHDGLQRAAQQFGGGRFQFVPALYTNWGSRSDHVWRSVNMAHQRGMPFGGAWVARTDTGLPGDACGAQMNWNGERQNIMGSTLPGPILISQYNLDCKLPAGEVDFSSINPEIDLRGHLLDRLFQPRG